MKRGEIWLCKLDPTVGSEIRKTRPCVIVSPDEMNAGLQTVLVAPMTSGGRSSPFRVLISFDDVEGKILPDQMRALDRRRLVKRLGAVDQQTLAPLLNVLREMFSD